MSSESFINNIFAKIKKSKAKNEEKATKIQLIEFHLFGYF
ncbi:hypothetical protein RC62_3210 [Flavobacterium aquidurense]|uniref:Uncharacterized protein n=1 Tax=Flavobacterium aquidurense TaxID=362413 RepID=A0A0Q0Y2S0_9FLAO|nr:hypothetical protein RC62_3210 [Flavobacterium aquidurense]